MMHTGDIKGKIQEARQTLFMADKYMEKLGIEFERLRKQKMTERQARDFIEKLIPVEKDASPVTVKNIKKLRNDMTARYFDAPDLQGIGNNAYRFVNAVSDFATHAAPIRRTKNYQENLFMKTYEGNPLIDKAYQMVLAAA